jgi:tetratricopeptide (TPR) repeat protein
MAEAHLAAGDRENAIREARLAIELNGPGDRARSVINRAQGEDETRRLAIEETLVKAGRMISKGNRNRAKMVLQRLLSKSPSLWPECHRLLASIYEADRLYDSAIAELRSFIGKAPDRASAEDAEKRINELRQMSGVTR